MRKREEFRNWAGVWRSLSRLGVDWRGPTVQRIVEGLKEADPDFLSTMGAEFIAGVIFCQVTIIEGAERLRDEDAARDGVAGGKPGQEKN